MLGVGSGIAVSDSNIGAGLGESESGGASETPGTTCDEAGLAPQRPGVECRHFGILLLDWLPLTYSELVGPLYRDSFLFCCQKVRRQRYNRGVPEFRKVVIYSRKGCHLCEVVKESLTKLSRRGGFTWQEVDVDSDTELRRQFNDEVPVVFIDGRKAFKYRMDEREFLRRLAS
jgi:glutaredoxin